MKAVLKEGCVRNWERIMMLMMIMVMLIATIWRRCPRPRQNCFQETLGGESLVKCEVSCDWHFQPLPIRC